ncbi:hypothetical protein [Pseudofrankia sp. BMG5.37]|uniref:hypothetical protein n=1 Tax=Pseudofrankia sp. BMG5.37 TaxID=3050035 RepID=UPI0028958936|nr:hypothetical protein [Pseudofrankia sp. BMG5.37]MDT3438971.1 hypothetical protein [Pseudofrankia sp. BMG5.37]
MEFSDLAELLELADTAEPTATSQIADLPDHNLPDQLRGSGRDPVRRSDRDPVADPAGTPTPPVD